MSVVGRLVFRWLIGSGLRIMLVENGSICVGLMFVRCVSFVYVLWVFMRFGLLVFVFVLLVFMISVWMFVLFVCIFVRCLW